MHQICPPKVYKIVHEGLGYCKVCARWVKLGSTDERKIEFSGLLYNFVNGLKSKEVGLYTQNPRTDNSVKSCSSDRTSWNKVRTTSTISFLNNQTDALIILILFCYKTLYVSGIFSDHHQEFSTVHSAMVSFMQVSDDRFQAESGGNILTLLGSGHQKPA